MFLVSSFLFALMGVFVKLASPYASANEIALARFSAGIVTALVLARSGKISLAANRKFLLIARGIISGLAIMLFFAAIKTGSLTNTTVLNNTYPIFATVFAAFYLKEKVRPVVILPLVLSVLGIVLLTRPDFSNIRTGDLLALASAIMAGMSVVMIRELRKTESAWAVFFYLSIFGAVFSGILALPDFVVPAYSGIVYMVFVAAFGTVGQVINTAAYKYCTASVGSVLSMSTAVFSSFFGLLFLGEKLTSLEAVGAAVILVSSTCVAYYGAAEQKAVKTGQPQ